MAGPYDCPECGRSFSSLAELTQHTEAEHTHESATAVEPETEPEALTEAADPEAVSRGGSQLALALLILAAIVVVVAVLLI